jgi:hypothetical protein
MLNDRRNVVQFPIEATDLYHFQNVRPGTGYQQVSYKICTGYSVPGDKSARRETYHTLYVIPKLRVKELHLYLLLCRYGV